MQEIGATLNRQDFDGICNDVDFDTDSYWECMLRHFAVTCYHPTSTCRMGSATDPTAVVDPQLRYDWMPSSEALIELNYKLRMKRKKTKRSWAVKNMMLI